MSLIQYILFQEKVKFFGISNFENAWSLQAIDHLGCVWHLIPGTQTQVAEKIDELIAPIELTGYTRFIHTNWFFRLIPPHVRL